MMRRPLASMRVSGGGSIPLFFARGPHRQESWPDRSPLAEEIVNRLASLFYEAAVAGLFYRYEQQARLHMQRVIDGEYERARDDMRRRFPYLYGVTGLRRAWARIGSHGPMEMWTKNPSTGHWEIVRHVSGGHIG